jgi:hypothetical protein
MARLTSSSLNRTWDRIPGRRFFQLSSHGEEPRLRATGLNLSTSRSSWGMVDNLRALYQVGSDVPEENPPSPRTNPEVTKLQQSL